MKPYVLLTAARNEAAHLDATLRAVAGQTARPLRWIVVSDGSTDDTDAIVERHARDLPFLQLHRRPAGAGRSFAAKALAINEGYGRLKNLDHEAVGILDADVTLPPDYYRIILGQFERDAGLGIAGGQVLDQVGDRFVPKRNSPAWSVCGPVQMFRRACFEQIGGYFPSRAGGVDAIAEVMARMRGWRVQTFPEAQAWHHRQTGSRGQSASRALFRLGAQNYLLGYHPLFMLARSLRRMAEPPFLLGGGLLLAGYAWAGARRECREVPDEFVRYLRREQLGRLRAPGSAR